MGCPGHRALWPPITSGMQGLLTEQERQALSPRFCPVGLNHTKDARGQVKCSGPGAAHL